MCSRKNCFSKKETKICLYLSLLLFFLFVLLLKFKEPVAMKGECCSASNDTSKFSSSSSWASRRASRTRALKSNLAPAPTPSPSPASISSVVYLLRGRFAALILLRLRSARRNDRFTYLDDQIPNFQQDSMALRNFILASCTVLKVEIVTHRNTSKNIATYRVSAK